ncbi:MULTISPECIES: methyl-accepting chemotaxis protein [unclassified Janthinobacterium]|uniref:methyl-accepting chemotaxis protein n=1 Tax=unclassified Janthinobacterium TaxID=2610881 RepID=UPI000349E38D|nr:MULTISPECIES: PAS domain-containing methyl-accepting chemotaxis protein [unclassified Janthinobacterium]MEC5160082.1 aerotaxis receptor [Janthinobacterium sp. CG_S6]
MRQNLLISQQEVHVMDDQAIVSKTDLNGDITYVNPYFCQISGYLEAELIGEPQNILRHPDMPVEAFADLWASLKAGTPWTGLVKNRCKNGAFYWVRANITPIMDQGKTVGYMSVRVKPERAEVAAAQRSYAAFKQGKAQGLRIKNGQLVHTGLIHLVANLGHMSLAMRIWLCTSVVNTLQLGVCAAVLFSTGSPASNYGIFGATLLGFLVNVFLWYTLRVSVLRPLNKAVGGARAIAAGDLSGSFDTGSTDEVGQLLRALQQMNSNLIATIRDVRVNVETMAVATRQIAAGNVDLSGRTESQAASLEETASSVEQFSATVKQNADNSIEANALAVAASKVAVEGGEIVADVITTMGDINASSRKIVDIISLIEGIAFQTNILALNAAVEAARAGEQGRGFAVVAGEVRNLAQRSATAAKDIKNLIEISVGKVSAGMVQVNRAGSTMEQVVSSVQQVTTIMQSISLASREQSVGVDQVNQAIAHMDQVTQQNAALVEEAAAAATSLAEEAGHLTQAVSLFKFGKLPQPQPRQRPARAAPAKPAPRGLKRLAA